MVDTCWFLRTDTLLCKQSRPPLTWYLYTLQKAFRSKITHHALASLKAHGMRNEVAEEVIDPSRE
jgi:hypothetical protein